MLANPSQCLDWIHVYPDSQRHLHNPMSIQLVIVMWILPITANSWSQWQFEYCNKSLTPMTGFLGYRVPAWKPINGQSRACQSPSWSIDWINIFRFRLNACRFCWFISVGYRALIKTFSSRRTTFTALSLQVWWSRQSFTATVCFQTQILQRWVIACALRLNNWLTDGIRWWVWTCEPFVDWSLNCWICWSSKRPCSMTKSNFTSDISVNTPPGTHFPPWNLPPLV